MNQEQVQSLSRSSSCNSWSPKKIIPTPSHNYTRSTSSSFSPDFSTNKTANRPLVRRGTISSNTNTNNSLSVVSRVNKTRLTLSAFLRSLLHVFSFSTTSFSAVPTCRWLTIPNRVLSFSSPTPLGRKVTGTLFGHRKGHVTFTVQDDSKSDPALVIELAISTSALVREMSSGLVRIALECERSLHPGRGKHGPKLFLEPVWTMYCNGRKCGYANSRTCNEFDWHVLSTVQSVSVGAGVIPLVENRTGSGSEGELLYMRAKFERVIGNRDSEAFYMLNPDGNGGPELSIFLLRL
ncbi:unnamed protein product [Amaranthus hypochondriacus]